MELKRVAAISVVAGAVGLSTVVGFVDWRAGVGLFFLFLIVGGLSSLRSPSG